MSARPQPVPDLLSQPFWDAAKRSQLMLQQCSDCGETVFPPLSHCPHCLEDTLTWTSCPLTGTVSAWARTHTTVVAGIEAPYRNAWVAMDGCGGVELVGFFEADGLGIGDRVVLGFDDRDGVVCAVFTAPETVES